MVAPSQPALAIGTVTHHRLAPTEHRFVRPVSMIWLDPDHPAPLFDAHRLWSTTRPAPVRFRSSDYLDGAETSFAERLGDLVEPVAGRRPNGPIRMLTQPRSLGWLFNPITIYLLWEEGPRYEDSAPPLIAVLEVTNTPWKERHHYVVELGDGGARFAKRLHVSPFLDEDFDYRLLLRTADRAGQRRLTVDLDVIAPGCIQGDTADGQPAATPTLRTHLAVDLIPPKPSAMSAFLLRNPFPTHRVSYGIQRQALALWRKRVPFIAHPNRR